MEHALDPDRSRGLPVRLGHAWSALGAYTTSLQRRWKRAHPGTVLEVLRLDERSAGLASGAVDVAVLRGPVGVPDVPGVTVAHLMQEPRLAAVADDSPLASRTSLTLADLATRPVALNTVTGSTTLALWPQGAAPSHVVPVKNTDDWLSVIIAGDAVGVTTAGTAAMHPNPAVRYVPLTDAPPVDVVLAWREPVTHPAVPDLLRLAHDVVRRIPAPG
ncbi:LysR substrate-binding domain-containing protein [Dactylosporangium sp. NBC_01737]|uniref:LysR substrate-binding domain-containing protein n=1 Tax=Dactylosporangium sp. NBC_01737 TaxID=2975959 RepID=UPI002E14BC60|nr:LysR substrate-binding domain-containing protein [Dactylosporangium sp. NBC_01737]